MARKEFLDYVWKYCVEPQLGYAFSLNHTMPYSIIAVQEANLATRWNPLFWQCACLCVNAGNYANSPTSEEEEDGVEYGDEGVSEEDEAEEELDNAWEENSPEENDEAKESESKDESKKSAKAAPNYSKISKAIADAQRFGIKVELPDINKAEKDFVPDIKTNTILYSLRAVNVVSDSLLQDILNNRPYSSLEDFIERVKPKRVQMLGLIKAGCFDALLNIPRGAIMRKYLQYEADKNFPVKEALTLTQIKKVISLGWTSQEYHNIIRIIKFKNYIDAKQKSSEEKRYVLTDEKCIAFFKQFFESYLNLSKAEYSINPGGVVAVKMSAFKKVFDTLIKPLVQYFNSDEGKEEYKRIVQGDFIQSFLADKCSGSASKWEMETMGFYYSEHELASTDKAKYDIKNFDDLPTNGSRDALSTLVGVVVGKNDTRHTITILSPDGMVVDVKFYGTAYTQYKRRISVINRETGKKKVIDDTWFKRGNKVIVYGFRRENMFHARKAKYRMIGLIEAVLPDGSLQTRFARKEN